MHARCAKYQGAKAYSQTVSVKQGIDVEISNLMPLVAHFQAEASQNICSYALTGATWPTRAREKSRRRAPSAPQIIGPYLIQPPISKKQPSQQGRGVRTYLHATHLDGPQQGSRCSSLCLLLRRIQTNLMRDPPANSSSLLPEGNRTRTTTRYKEK